MFIRIDLTYSDLATTIPFENSIDTFDLRGEHLKALFEHAVDDSWGETFESKWLTQVSGNECIQVM